MITATRLIQSSFVYILAIIAIILTVVGQILVKVGVNTIVSFVISLPMLVRAFTDWRIIIGFSLAFAGSIFWLGVIAKLPFSIAYPMLSLNYVFSLIAARYVFHEQIPPWRIAGTIVICFGVIMAVRQ